MLVWLIKQWLAWRARRTTRTLTVGELERSYSVHVPPGYAPDRPVPVLLALHGATMTGPLMAWLTGLDAKADEAGFLAVYPDGTGRRSSFYWNGGNCCGAAARSRVDDVAFIRALLDDLAVAYRIDPRRVFAAGLSNGAMMAYRLASELSDRIAAVACVAGTMGTEGCRPARPVSVLHFHGTEDEYIPFAGGKGRRSLTGVHHQSVEDSVRTWVRANGCDEEPAIEALPDRAGDGTRVVRKAYRNGRDGSEVVLVIVEGGGHTWPGRDLKLKALGRTTKNVMANDLMWGFFAEHPME